MRKQLFSQRSTPRRGVQGQSLVEIALILPVILVLFLGLAEVAFILYAHVQVANAAREGARRGSLCRFNGNCATLATVVETAVKNEPGQALNMNGSNTVVTVQPASLSSAPAVGTPLTVTVAYTHTLPFVSNIVPMFPAEISLEHSSVMRFDK